MNKNMALRCLIKTTGVPAGNLEISSTVSDRKKEKKNKTKAERIMGVSP